MLTRQTKNLGAHLLEKIIATGLLIMIGSWVFYESSDTKIKRHDTRRISDMSELMIAMAMYKQEAGFFPTNYRPGEEFKLPSGKVLMKKAPKDPAPQEHSPNCKNTEYSYDQLNHGQTFRIKYCLAKDMTRYPAGNCVTTPNNVCGCNTTDDCEPGKTCSLSGICTTDECRPGHDEDCQNKGTGMKCVNNKCVRPTLSFIKKLFN